MAKKKDRPTGVFVQKAGKRVRKILNNLETDQKRATKKRKQK